MILPSMTSSYIYAPRRSSFMCRIRYHSKTLRRWQASSPTTIRSPNRLNTSGSSRTTASRLHPSPVLPNKTGPSLLPTIPTPDGIASAYIVPDSVIQDVAYSATRRRCMSSLLICVPMADSCTARTLAAMIPKTR